MWFLKHRFVSASAIGTILFCVSACQADSYRDPTRHFSFRFPADWERLPSSFVDATNELVSQSVRNDDVRYEHGFGQKREVPGTFPYVLLQVMRAPFAGSSYEQIQEALGAAEQSVDIEGPLGDMLRTHSIDIPVLDRSKNRFVTQIHMDLEGTGKVRGLSVGYFGKSHVVLLHCYALDADFERFTPQFATILDSFQFEPGFAFTPNEASPDKTKSIWKRVLKTAGIAGIAGGGATIVLLLISLLGRKDKDKSFKLRGQDYAQQDDERSPEHSVLTPQPQRSTSTSQPQQVPPPTTTLHQPTLLPVTCPNCTSRHTAPKHTAGKRVRCPKCSHVFVLPIAPANPA